MPTAISGTNGVLQSYDFQTPVTGFSYTFSAGTLTLIMNPAGTLATGTITMPASPADGMVITIQSTQQITALTVQGNTGQSLVGGTMTMRANQPESFIYRLTNTTWYPFAGAANSQIVSGTSQASTSGTSIDFTGIPSWVKRITVMLNGVSTNGSSNFLVQLGDAGGIETSGYSAAVAIPSTTTAPASSTAGLIVLAANSASDLWYGAVTLSLLDSATRLWTSTGSLTNGAGVRSSAGAKSLSDTLTQVRITTVNGTDTFDAGTINILYE